MHAAPMSSGKERALVLRVGMQPNDTKVVEFRRENGLDLVLRGLDGLRGRLFAKFEREDDLGIRNEQVGDAQHEAGHVDHTGVDVAHANVERRPALQLVAGIFQQHAQVENVVFLGGDRELPRVHCHDGGPAFGQTLGPTALLQRAM